MLSIGRLLIESLDYIMIVDKEFNIIYNTRYDHTIGDPDGGKKSKAYTARNYFEVYPNLKKEESSVYRCIKTGEVIVQKNQRYEDYVGGVYVTNNVTLPLKRKGKLIAAVEITLDMNLEEESKQLAESRFDEFVKRVREASGKITFDTILTENAEMKRNIEKAKVLSQIANPVLIYGETGTGKELFAQAMIEYSGIPSDNVVIQNCAAVPENLIESILFGTVRGAYTGAENHKGLFDVADGGIIFLDELNTMPFNVQAKLLRVLQDGTFRPLGSNFEKKVNVKVIAAMNIDPIIAIEKNILRRDLFYRFSSGLITLTPLRERKEDIRLFLQYYMKYFSDAYGKNIKGIDPALQESFIDYTWDGNVRELMNTIEYMVTSAGNGSTLCRELLPEYLCNKFPVQVISISKLMEKDQKEQKEYFSDGPIPYYLVMEKIEREMIIGALRQAKGNKSQAADILGLPRQTMKYRMKILDIKGTEGDIR